MAKYRVLSGMYANNQIWYLPQRKGWFFWHKLHEGYMTSNYFNSFEGAKDAIEQDKKFREHKDRVVWEEQ